MRNLLGILFFNSLFCVAAMMFLEWIGVENFTLNVIIWVAMLPVTIKASEPFLEP